MDSNDGTDDNGARKSSYGLREGDNPFVQQETYLVKLHSFKPFEWFQTLDDGNGSKDSSRSDTSRVVNQRLCTLASTLVDKAHRLNHVSGFNGSKKSWHETDSRLYWW